MSTTIMGKKLGMMQVFNDQGNCVSVTLVEAGPCVVVQKRTPAKHKYSAIQIGFEAVAGRKLSKPQLGVFERADLSPMRYLREVRLTPEEVDAYKIGDNITASIFAAGEKVDISGTSKGKGFQGVVKRYHMKGTPRRAAPTSTGGMPAPSECARNPAGSSRASTCPGRWATRKSPPRT